MRSQDEERLILIEQLKERYPKFHNWELVVNMIWVKAYESMKNEILGKSRSIMKTFGFDKGYE